MKRIRLMLMYAVAVVEIALFGLCHSTVVSAISIRTRAPKQARATQQQRAKAALAGGGTVDVVELGRFIHNGVISLDSGSESDGDADVNVITEETAQESLDALDEACAMCVKPIAACTRNYCGHMKCGAICGMCTDCCAEEGELEDLSLPEHAEDVNTY